MTSRIGYTPGNHKLYCNEVLEDITFERQSEVDMDIDTSSTDSGSEDSSPSKTKNSSQISPQKPPLGLNLNKEVTPIGSNPDVGRLAIRSEHLKSTMRICKENARDSFKKGVAALNEKQDEKATLYAQRSNEYIEQYKRAREGIQEVQRRIFQGVEVVPTQKS